jgi:hypothetical protein
VLNFFPPRASFRQANTGNAPWNKPWLVSFQLFILYSEQLPCIAFCDSKILKCTSQDHIQFNFYIKYFTHTVMFCYRNFGTTSPFFKAQEVPSSWAVCPKTSVANHQATPRNISEESRPKYAAASTRTSHVAFNFYCICQKCYNVTLITVYSHTLQWTGLQNYNLYLLYALRNFELDFRYDGPAYTSICRAIIWHQYTDFTYGHLGKIP